MVELINDEGCLVTYDEGFVQDVDALFAECLTTDPFQPTLKFKGGTEVLQPRLISWLSDDPSLTYTYSGVFLEPKPMPPLIRHYASMLQTLLGSPFPTCLMNLYRDGNDSVGLHSDNEKELGKGCTIAAISLGAERTFQLQRRADKKQRVSQVLKSGSLVVMAGATQSLWAHQIPKEPEVKEMRASLTFRPHVRSSTKEGVSYVKI